MSNQPDEPSDDELRALTCSIMLTVELAKKIRAMSPTDAKALLIAQHIPVEAYEVFAAYNAKQITLQDCVRRIWTATMAQGKS